jgi:hypothetical protein
MSRRILRAPKYSGAKKVVFDPEFSRNEAKCAEILQFDQPYIKGLAVHFATAALFARFVSRR